MLWRSTICSFWGEHQLVFAHIFVKPGQKLTNFAGIDRLVIWGFLRNVLVWSVVKNDLPAGEKVLEEMSRV